MTQPHDPVEEIRSGAWAAARRRAKTRRIKGAGTCRKPNDSLTWLVNNLVIQLDVTCDILVCARAAAVEQTRDRPPGQSNSECQTESRRKMRLRVIPSNG